MSDSKLVIDWANLKYVKLENLVFNPILILIKELRSPFEYISLTHVFIELNSHANNLSKVVLIL